MFYFGDSENKTPDIQGDIWRLIIATPKILIFLGGSFLSGHLWLYLIHGHYIRRKGTDSGKKILDTYYGKVAMGAVWLGIFLYLTHLMRYKSFSVQNGNELLGEVYNGLILGAAIQFMVLVVTVVINSRKN